MARSSDSNFLVSLVRDQTFQMRQIRRVLLLAGVFVVISTIVLGAFYHYILGRLVAGTGPMLFAADDLQRLDQQMPALSSVLGSWLLIMLLINLLLTAAVAVYIVRKLGSPLMAIKRALSEVASGNLDVRLRASDSREFKEVTEALNGAMEQVQSRIREAQDEAGLILEEQPLPDEQQVRQALSNCHHSLSFFRTGSATAELDDHARVVG